MLLPAERHGSRGGGRVLDCAGRTAFWFHRGRTFRAGVPGHGEGNAGACPRRTWLLPLGDSLALRGTSGERVGARGRPRIGREGEHSCPPPSALARAVGFAGRSAPNRAADWKVRAPGLWPAGSIPPPGAPPSSARQGDESESGRPGAGFRHGADCIFAGEGEGPAHQLHGAGSGGVSRKSRRLWPDGVRPLAARAARMRSSVMMKRSRL